MGQKKVNFNTKLGIRCSTDFLLRLSKLAEYYDEEQSTFLRRLVNEEYIRIFLSKNRNKSLTKDIK